MNNLLQRIKENNMAIEENDGKLKLHFLTDEINQELIGEIKEKKEELIAMLQSQQRVIAQLPKVALSDQGYRLSSSQHRLWVLSQFENGSIAYNMPRSLPLEGNYSSENLVKAIAAVIDRHEILRTVFRENKDAKIRQWILTSNEINFKLIQHDFRTEKNPVDAASKFQAEDAFKEFDLNNGPLFRAALLQTADTEFVLYFNMHHIISDGWSIDLLAQETMAFHQAFENDTAPQILPLNLQYKDFSAWQISQFETTTFKKYKAFWIDKLSGELPKLNLPSFIKRPLVKTYNERSFETYLSKELSEGIRSYSRANNGSTFIGLLAGVNAILYRYTNQNEFILGTPVAGRDHSDLSDQIGCYINVLALRNQVAEEGSFKSLFSDVKENTIEAYDNQQYPFDQIVEDLNLKRDTSRSPVFDMMIVMQNISENKEQPLLSDKEVDAITDLGPGMGKFDLNFIFVEVGDYISLQVSYNTDVYEKEIIIQLIGHFKRLLEVMLANPEENIKALTYLLPTEKNVLIEDFNQTIAPYSENTTLVDILENRTISTPDKIGFIDAEKEISYVDLNAYANQIGYELQAGGIAKDKYVCLHLSRSIELIAGTLGILKTGGIYVPFEPSVPAGRKIQIIKNLDIEVIITDRNHLDAILEMLPELNGLKKIICLGNSPVEKLDSRIVFEPEIRQHPTANLNCEISPEDEAYVIFTSGSTGLPKGVVVQHKPVNNLLEWVNETYGVNPSDKLLMVASISFDLSVYDIFGSILAGSEVRIASHEELKNIERLVEIIYTEKITFWDSAPGALSQLMPTLIENYKQGKRGNLRLVFMSGDWIPLQISNELKMCFENIDVIALGGATEAVIWSNHYEIKTINKNWLSIPYGKPIWNACYYVLDEYLSPSPIGVEGDLFIGGEVLAKEYKNDPELTATKFINSPFKQEGKIYKTGDRARFYPDGNIEFRGRKDHQVKIRGYRIELGEIEQTFLKIDGIDDVVVVTRGEEREGKELVAYLVANEQLSVTQLRSELQRTLPDYMVPAHFVQLDQIPVTVNGKVDKKKLLNESGIEIASGVTYEAPVSDQEIALVNVWTDILKKEQIGIQDNFFDLGGDSIKSIQVVSRLKQYGYALKVEHILRNPVLQNLVGFMTVAAQTIDQSVVQGEVLLTPIQKLFFEDKAIKDKSHYNQSIALASANEVDFSGLQKCLVHLTKHHDALRMIFKEDNGHWRQTNKGIEQNAFELIEHCLKNEEDDKIQMERLCNSLQASINLNEGPLFKVGLFRLSKGDRLVIIAHHLVIDGVSWRILLEDLSLLYQQFLAEEKLNLPSKTSSYQKWGTEIDKYINSENSNKELKYWNKFVSKNKTDREDNPSESENEAHFQLSVSQTKALQTKINKVYKTEVNDILLSVLGEAMKMVSEEKQWVIQLEGHGREEIIDGIDITRTIGWFTALYPFMLDASDENENRLENLVKTKEAIRQIPNKGIGFGMLLSAGKIDKEQVKTDITFNYLGDFGSRSKDEEQLFSFSGEARGRNSAVENGNFMGTPLSITGIIEGGQLTVMLKGNNVAYNAAKLAELNKAFQLELTEIIDELETINTTYTTPSDFSFKGLSIAELNSANCNNDIEDIYPLSPLQEGMYFHWKANEESPYYFQQFSYRLKKNGLDINAVEDCFNILLQRHPILRTSFSNEYAGEQLQIVRNAVHADFRFISINDALANDIDHLKKADREEGFDLNKESQMRLTVVQINTNQFEFIWSCHHILMDGWCISILVNEFYQLLSAGDQRDTILSTTPPLYSDYINWLNDIDEEKSLAYWNDYLAGTDQVSNIPFKQNVQFAETIQMVKSDIVIEGNQLEALRDLCKSLEITENSFVQGVWGYLLSKYNGTNDVTFGAVVSGRPGEIEKIEQMIGLFINTIPVRISYKGTDSPKDLLKKVQKEAIESIPHHYLTLSEIQAQSALGAHLIDHILVFENYAIQEVEAAENVSEEIEILSRDSFDQNHYGFSIQVLPGRAQMTLSICYDKLSYRKEDIERLTIHFTNLLKGFIEKPTQELSQIEYLTAEEKTVFPLIDKATFSIDKSVKILFEEQVIKSPQNIALKWKDKSFTYQEVNEKANQLAAYLTDEHDIVLGDFVGVSLERSERMVIALLAVLKTGGVYVPIDPNYPKERIEFTLKDSNCKYLIDKVTLAKFDTVKDKFGKHNPDVKISPSDLIYVIYTSGTTGKPKGVLLEHKNVLSLFKSKEESFKFSESDVWTMFHSFCFDVSVWEMYGALLYGGTLVIVPNATTKDPALFHELLKKEDVTILSQTPSAFYSLQSEILQSKQIDLALRAIIFGGEKLTPNRLREWHDKFQKTTLINMYGITETTVHSTYKEITAKEIRAEESNIGRVLPTLNSYILDSNQSRVPYGATGELYIGGLGVSRGYLNRPELTKERFLTNPFNKDEILYKSGDKVKFLSNGELEYFGRLDKQVKVRGYRIEIREIEIALERLKTIEQAVVIAKTNETNETDLIAYFQGESEVSAKDLRDGLSEELPLFMIPSVFIYLKEFPRTINGKLDRNALPAPNQSALNISTVYEAPANQVEETLVDIWQVILKKEKIGINDNFFELGGHSLKALKLIAKIQQEFKVKIDVGKIFGEPNIKELALEIENRIWLNEKDASVADEEDFDLETLTI